MSDDAPEIAEEGKKPSKLPIFIGVFLAILAGIGGYAFTAGLGPFGANDPNSSAESHHANDAHGAASSAANSSMIVLDPVVVSLPPTSGHRHLRVAIQLEVEDTGRAQIEAQIPHFIDMMNGYLRAIEVAELEDPAILHRIKAHLLARMNVLTNSENIKSVLIIEFVLT